jgi:hypothetical protein
MLGVQHKNIYATIVKLDHAFIALCCTRCQDCSNTSDKNAGRSLHKCPNDESLRRISVRFVQTKHANFYPSSRGNSIHNLLFCLDHFSTDCFERLFHLDGLQRRLKPGSVHAYYLEESACATNNERQA